MNMPEEHLDIIDDLFLRYGIRSVSMDDISRRIGISKKTLYQYTASKTELVEYVMNRHRTIDETTMAVYATQGDNAVDSMMNIAHYILQTLKKISPKTVYELRKYYRSVYDDYEVFHKKHIYAIVKNNLERGITEGHYRDDINSDIVAKLYMSRTVDILDDTIFNHDVYRLYDVSLEHIKLHFYGVCTSKGLKLFQKYAKRKPEILPTY